MNAAGPARGRTIPADRTLRNPKLCRTERASDAFVNIPGVLPGMPAAQALTMISRLPGVAASAGYLGLNANPVVHGKVNDSFLTDDLTGSFAGRASPPTASARTG